MRCIVKRINHGARFTFFDVVFEGNSDNTLIQRFAGSSVGKRQAESMCNRLNQKLGV